MSNSSLIPNSCLKTAFSVNTNVSNATKLSLAHCKEIIIYVGLTLFCVCWVSHPEGHILVSNDCLFPDPFSLIIWKYLSCYSWSTKPGFFSSFKSKCYFNTVLKTILYSVVPNTSASILLSRSYSTSKTNLTNRCTLNKGLALCFYETPWLYLHVSHSSWLTNFLRDPQ